VFALALLTAAKPSHAEEDAQRSQRFIQAGELMKSERWSEAKARLEQLWSERRTYDVALNLGLTEYNLKHIPQAANYLSYALATIPPREKPEAVKRARDILAICKAELGTMAVTVDNNGAEIYVDGAALAPSPPVNEVYVTPGTHGFEVRLDAHDTEKWEAEFVAGQKQTRHVALRPTSATTLAALPNGTTPRAAPAPVPFKEPEAKHGSWVPVIVGGALTLAGAAVGTTFEILRSNRRDDSQSLLANLDNNDCSSPAGRVATSCRKLHDANRDYDNYGRYELTGFAISGVALAATAAYFFITRPDHGKRENPNSTPSTLQFNATLSRERSFVTVGTNF
jgi:hypothetical protein